MAHPGDSLVIAEKLAMKSDEDHSSHGAHQHHASASGHGHGAGHEHVATHEPEPSRTPVSPRHHAAPSEQEAANVHTHHEHAGHGAHAGHEKHAGHSVGMFRDRFWISLLLTLPTLVWGHMLQSSLGYTAPHFPGSMWIPALFGTAVFLYGGWVFIQGAVRELKDRLPGMMTLIALAITVAFVFSAVVTLTSSPFRWPRGSSPLEASCFRQLLGRCSCQQAR